MRVKNAIVRLAVLAMGLVVSTTAPSQAAGPSVGTKIVNTAVASYSAGSTNFVSSSNTITTTVSQVSGIAVTPKQSAANVATDNAGLGIPLVRTFILTNTSNIPDAYVVTAAACAPAILTAITYQSSTGPATIVVGQTVLPVVQPAGTIAVTVTCSTTSLAVGTTIPVTLAAKTTVGGSVNGIQSDSGQQFGIMVPPPALSGPGGAGAAITKTVANGSVSAAVPLGAATTYTITFMNSGNVPATNTVMTDTFPTGITPDPSSVTLNGATTGFTASLSGQTLTVNVGTLAVKATDVITLKATVGSAQIAGASYVNVATVAADGLVAKPTTAATVLSGASNVVYDGLAGQSHTVMGAVVTLADPTTQLPLPLGTVGIAPNAANANPFTTGTDGVYQFSPFATGSTTPYGHFVIMIVAPNYADRTIDVTITLDSTTLAGFATAATFRSAKATVSAPTQLYDVTLKSLDGQPLAQAGQFTLTTSQVQISNVFDLLGNLPLFTARPITVTKTADRTQAAAGDKIIYTVSYADNSTGPIGAGSIIDTLPAGMVYVPNSAKIDGVSVTPTINGRNLIWPLAALTIGVAHQLQYATVILPGTPAYQKLTNTVTVGGTIPGTTLPATGSAAIDVFTTTGLFSDTGVITGRVFVDAFGTGHFRKGDAGVSGVRVFMESGEFAQTDSNGRYTFPGVRPGQHVLRLDPLSFPEGISPFADARYDSPKSTTRLVHGLMDTGSLEDINFALQGPKA